MTALPVLSVNCFVMGHAPYQLGLEAAFADSSHGIDFQSVHLPRANRSDLIGRIAYHLLTLRIGRATAPDWDWHRLRSEVATSFFLRRLLARLVPVRRPAVLHVHTQSIALLSAGILRRMPSVISMDCTTALLARLHPAPAARTYRPIMALERRCLQAAWHVVCWSEVARRSVLDDYGVNPARVSVVRPALAPGAWAPRPSKEAARPGARLRLLFVGNDFQRKGGVDLVEVYRTHLRETCELDVVSHGAHTLPGVDGLRLHSGLTANSPELKQLYADADVFVMPTYEDAFGLVYVEAMAAGLPCIGSDVLAVKELVQHGVTGLTVKAGDRVQLRQAIETLRDDRAMRHHLALGARAFVDRECDAEVNSRRLASIFRQVQDERLTGAGPR